MGTWEDLFRGKGSFHWIRMIEYLLHNLIVSVLYLIPSIVNGNSLLVVECILFARETFKYLNTCYTTII